MNTTPRTARTINLRSPREIERMRPAGRIVWEAHQAAASLVRPGVTTAELDQAVEDVFRRYEAEPLFKGVPGPMPFPAATCISVNEEVVHGIPGTRALAAGDIVSLDTGCRVDGWCGDAAVTHAVEPIDPEARRLLDVTSQVLRLAVQKLGVCSRWSEVAGAMQEFVQGHGFSVVTAFCGHGIGRDLHELPQAPNCPSASADDFLIKPGLVLAVEPMVNAGRPEVRCLEDGWTQVADDGSLSAHFEHTIAITDAGPQVLTGNPHQESWPETL